jgi:hypothetical protein
MPGRSTWNLFWSKWPRHRYSSSKHVFLSSPRQYHTTSVPQSCFIHLDRNYIYIIVAFYIVVKTVSLLSSFLSCRNLFTQHDCKWCRMLHNILHGLLPRRSLHSKCYMVSQDTSKHNFVETRRKGTDFHRTSLCYHLSNFVQVGK